MRLFLFIFLIVLCTSSGCLDFLTPKHKVQPSQITPIATLTIQAYTPEATPPQVIIRKINDYNISVSTERNVHPNNLTVFMEYHISVIPRNITLSCNKTIFRATFSSEPNSKGFKISVFDINCLPLSKAYINFDKHNISIILPKEGETLRFNLTE